MTRDEARDKIAIWRNRLTADQAMRFRTSTDEVEFTAALDVALDALSAQALSSRDEIAAKLTPEVLSRAMRICDYGETFGSDWPAMARYLAEALESTRPVEARPETPTERTEE